MEGSMAIAQKTGKKVIFLLLGLGAAFLAIGILNLRDRISWNDPSDGIFWTEKDQQMAVIRITGDSVPDEIREGDYLVRINNRNIHSKEEYIERLFLFNPGDVAEYQLMDYATGDLKTVKILIFARPILTITDFFKVLVAIVYFIVGLLILIQYWKARGSIHFYLVCLLSFVLYLYSYTSELYFLDFLVYWLNEIAILFLPPTFLHFCFNFPVQKKWMKGKILVILTTYLPSVIFLIIHILWFAGKLRTFPLTDKPFLPLNETSIVLLDNLHIIFFTIYFLVSIVVLFHSRVSLESPEFKQQMKWIINGITLSLVPFFFLYVLPYVLNLKITPLMESSILSLAFLPLFFAYAIMKYRLMDIDILFKRGASYIIASAAVLGLYFLFIALSSVVFRLFFPGSDTLAIATSALLVAFLFAPIRRKVQQEIDRFFYKEEYKYRQSLIEFGHRLSTESSMKTVTSTIIERANKSLNVKTVAIFLKLPGEIDNYELVAYAGMRPPADDVRYFKIPHQFLISSLDVPTLSFRIFEEEEQSDRLYSQREFYENLSLFYFQPLHHRNERIGVIALGKAEGNVFLSSEDLELLNVLAGYSAIALENARLYSSVQNKARELELLKVYSENIIEGINVGVVAVDRDGAITTWNQAMSQIYGMDYREVVGDQFKNVFPDDVFTSILRALDSEALIAQDITHIYKLFMKNKRDEKKFVNMTLSPFHDSTEKVIGTLIVFDDITDKIQLEHQLMQSEKLSSLGLIAAGVAHEVNTPLTGISSFTQMLISEHPSGHPHHDILNKIEKQCDRATQIVNNLLNFARIQTTEFSVVHVNNLLEECVSLLEHQFRKKNTEIIREMQSDLPPVKGNEGGLMQVFINILLNARDAVPVNGQIILRTLKTDNSAIVQIEDNGAGIPNEMIHRIYDPFFTTKDTARGTGLGLSVSYGIIQRHSGRIFVDSQPGEGTCFTIKLPMFQESESKEIIANEEQH